MFDPIKQADKASQAVLNFWFKEIDSKFWFKKDTDFDSQVREKFESLVQAAMRGECFGFRSTAGGRLAEIILLDQFTRNIYRDTPMAFGGDMLALVLSQELVRFGFPEEFSANEKAFSLMPHMHSESPRIHQEAEIQFGRPGLEYFLDFELRHKKIIDRFGRYPHRNDILGRPSTPEEISFLQEPGSSF